MRLVEYLADLLRLVGAWWEGEKMTRVVWGSDRRGALGGATEYAVLSFEMFLGGKDWSDSLPDFLRQLHERESEAVSGTGMTIICLRGRCLHFSMSGEPSHTVLFYRGEILGPPTASSRELCDVETRLYERLRMLFDSPSIDHSVDAFARRFDGRRRGKPVYITS